MDVGTLTAPSWTRREKLKQRALVALAILASAIIASAPRNERRLFAFPHDPLAFSAIAAPLPTTLRSPIMGYLDDGCAPDVVGGTAGFQRALDERDCGKGRRRPVPPAPVRAEPIVPAAYFAMPDDPLTIDRTPLIETVGLAPAMLELPFVRPVFMGVPIRVTSFTPPALVSSIPEPRGWALMIGGFALAGAVMRRRRRAVSVTFRP